MRCALRLFIYLAANMSQYVHFAEETMDLITKSTVPGAFLADLLPFRKDNIRNRPV